MVAVFAGCGKEMQEGLPFALVSSLSENEGHQVKFSIIVPVYKVEPYLERCVQFLQLEKKTD